MITDDVFRQEMDAILKKIGHKKKERDLLISQWLVLDVDRDAVLDMQMKLIPVKEPIKSEAWEQKQFVAWFKQTYPNTDIMMIRNDGYRTGFEKAEQIAMGLLEGAADLFVPDWHLWIEMKRSDGGAGQSDAQKAFEKRRSLHYEYLLCNGFEDAKKKILDFLNKLY